MLRDLSAYKKMLMLGIVGLVLVAAFDTFSNLPVVSGCAFYSNCAIDGSAEAPIGHSQDPALQ
ncbi:conserved hypothetical protein [Mesorhizobium prunaredense]|uniref:Uncharacterized protein n=1 Tax=Mesorhizobium prunaredense TaxID=1631249 RepID=A0A1R3VGX9_9HYPH|nr:conserved hypothetical protein [Mesorhizobium prunaredense]